MEKAEAAVEKKKKKIKNTLVEEKELRKVKNKTESLITFEDMSLMNRAGSLSFCSLLGNTNMINEELERYQGVSAAELPQEAEIIFDPNNSVTMYYFGNH